MTNKADLYWRTRELMEPGNAKAHCGICKFYQPLDDPENHDAVQGYGQCRRLSPNEGWARVEAADWCGRFKPVSWTTRRSWLIEA